MLLALSPPPTTRVACNLPRSCAVVVSAKPRSSARISPASSLDHAANPQAASPNCSTHHRSLSLTRQAQFGLSPSPNPSHLQPSRRNSKPTSTVASSVPPSSPILDADVEHELDFFPLSRTRVLPPLSLF
ncbi:hypothetical protein M0R45_036932 [Rubus argutus]|uniref:Uncharacterized protein n=1 Tax=Rubus argutus TaxID=59490 RepID=A0AAW1W148_RUBAR